MARDLALSDKPSMGPVSHKANPQRYIRCVRCGCGWFILETWQATAFLDSYITKDNPTRLICGQCGREVS